MAIPTKDARRIVVDGVTYRRQVDHDRLAWDKGLDSDARIVIQAAPAGQLLVADFTASHHEAGDAPNMPLPPSLARKLIEAGPAKSWMATERTHTPFSMDEAEVRRATGSRADGRRPRTRRGFPPSR